MSVGREAVSPTPLVPAPPAARGVPDRGRLTWPAPGRSLTVGRDTALADAVLEHPAVSRLHAELSTDAAGSLTVHDLGSTNGTYVNGTRAATGLTVDVGDLLEIGPFAFRAHRGVLVPVTGGAGPRVRLEGVTYRARGGGPVLLHELWLDVPGPGVVCVIGPSGCGKSTLLRLLAGRLAPSAGVARLNGVDIHGHYQSVKHLVAYAPQREALFEDLTVAATLGYSAELRLPSDTTAAEADAVALAASRRVGLESRLGSRVRTLSGGQRRRLALASELLGTPSVLLLDEVTSGLDDEAAHEVMALVRSLADGGLTVFCVTHTAGAVVPYADQVLALAPGGYPAFYAPPAALLASLGIAGIEELYQRVRAAPGPELAAAYHARHAPHAPHRAAGVDAASAASPVAAPAARQYAPRRVAGHAWALSRRTVDIVAGERRGALLALAQSVGIGLALRVLFGAGSQSPARAAQLVFLLGISAFWFGCNNAVKEITREREMLRQEWAAGLSLSAYALSKWFVLGALAAAQTIVLMGVATATGVSVGGADTLAVSVAGAIAGTSLGLLVSALAPSVESAATALPLLLIPQLLFSGALVSPLPAVVRPAAEVAVSAYHIQHAAAAMAGGANGEDTRRAVVALAGHAAVCGAATLLALRRAVRRA